MYLEYRHSEGNILSIALGDLRPCHVDNPNTFASAGACWKDSGSCWEHVTESSDMLELVYMYFRCRALYRGMCTCALVLPIAGIHAALCSF